MSSEYCGVDDYCFLLDDHDLKAIASKFCENYSEKEYDSDSFKFIYELTISLDITYLFDFTGDAFALSSDGYTLWLSDDNISYDCETVCFVPTKKYASLFKASYKNFDEVIAEFKKEVGRYLPDDFDYKAKLRHITGSYFCS